MERSATASSLEGKLAVSFMQLASWQLGNDVLGRAGSEGDCKDICAPPDQNPVR